MKLRRKILLGILGTALLAPCAGVYWVATTESGLRFLVSRLHKAGPVTLTAGQISGTLTKGVRISSLRVQHRLADIRIEDAQARVKLLPLLLRRQIHMPEFTARRMEIIQLHDPVVRPKRPPRFLPAMLRIDADDVRVGALTLTLKSGRALAFRGISSHGTVLPQQIRVGGTELDWEDWHLSGNGRMHAARPYGLEGEFDALWRPAGQPQWRIGAKFDGDLADLPLTAEVREPFLASIKGRAVLTSDWRLEGHAGIRDFALEKFGGSAALGLISGELDLIVNRDDIAATGRLTPPGLHAGAFDVDFHGKYEEKQLEIRETALLHPQSGTRATVRGSVTIEPGGPRLALNGEWAQLRWPLVGPEPAFTSAKGRYALEGVKPWQVRGDGEVIAAGLPAMPAQVRGRLGGESFLIDEAALQLFGGSAQFTGEARWKPAESWQVQGRMSGLDPAHLRGDLPGDLDFDFHANGAPFGATGSIEFQVADLGGKLREKKASGKGIFLRPGGSTDWSFRDVDLSLGTARVRLDGSMGTHSDLNFSVQASDLSLFDPEARGSLNATGRYAGTRTAPLLKGSARGSGFQWQGYELERFEADLDIDLTGSPGRAQGNVVLAGAKVGARVIDSVSFALTGSGERQQLALQVAATPVAVAMAAEGSVRDGLWQGQLTSLAVSQQDRATLRNETPAPLAFNLQQLELGQVCLKGTQERLCASGQHLAGAWSAAFFADALPLTTFTAGLSKDFDYDGTIDLRGELAGRPDTLPTGSIQGQLKQARLRHRLGSGREEIMSLGTGTVSANATASAFSFQVALDAGNAGSIQGRIDGERLRGDWRDFPIRGSLDAQTDGLSLLDIYIGEIDKASGRLSTRVDIAGTLSAPTLQGTLQLREASIDIYRIDLALRELSLDARFDTNALDLSGQSKLGSGMARFDGRLAWRDGLPFGNLHVKGDDLQVVNVPEASIRASPDLNFKIEGRRIDASGSVQVPYGRIEPADLTTAVLASSDEELVGDPELDPSLLWTVVSNIRLEVGNDVRIQTLGLDARLGGALQLRTGVTQNTRAEGELTISDGKYAAVGRQLDIQSGRLIYNNVPLNDPGIDLRAQKVLPEVTAGVIVRGSLRDPRLIFYSEPALPQSQIASLILAGGSLSSLGESQAPGAARSDLLAQGGAILAQRLGGQVGIDDVGIETGGGADTSLVLGKYLSDRLYISYGISLAEAINTLKLRWTITDRWTIRTEAGQERAADIVFTLKK